MSMNTLYQQLQKLAEPNIFTQQECRRSTAILFTAQRGWFRLLEHCDIEPKR